MVDARDEADGEREGLVASRSLRDGRATYDEGGDVYDSGGDGGKAVGGAGTTVSRDERRDTRLASDGRDGRGRDKALYWSWWMYAAEAAVLLVTLAVGETWVTMAAGFG